MGAKRISKLQRWILGAALSDKENIVPARREIAAGFWGAEPVYKDCILNHRYHSPRRLHVGKQYVVSVSRTLRGLLKKGLIRRGDLGLLVLTDEGRAEAVNNKRSFWPVVVNNKGKR